MITELKKIISQETNLLSRFAICQEELKGVVVRRDWGQLEKSIAGLQLLSERIEELEQERIRSFQDLQKSLGAGHTEPVSQLLAHLKGPEGRELFDLYRNLKIAVIRLKGGAGRLGYYLRSLTESTSRILEEFFPHRKGTIYSRSGRSKAAVEDSMVVNRRL